MRSFLAYVDPGSASYLLQLLAGGALAAAVSGRLLWRRVRLFLKRPLSRSRQ